MTEIEPSQTPDTGQTARPSSWAAALKICLHCLGAVTKLVLVLALVLGLAIVFWPEDRVVPFPDWARDRISTRAGAQMPGAEVAIGQIGLGRSATGRRPQIILQDVTLSMNGAERVSLPEVSVDLDGMAALTGNLQPRRIFIRDAGLRLTRGTDGRLGLTLSGEQTAVAGDLAQTMAGLDRMFANPFFAELEELRGESIGLNLENTLTGDVFEVADATMSLVPSADGMRFTVGGYFDEARNAHVEISCLRHGQSASTEIEARFENVQTSLISQASEALTFLSLIDAPLTGELSTELFDDLSLGHLIGQLEVGAGQFSAGGDLASQELESLSFGFDYDVEQNRLRVDRFALEAPSFSGQIEGHADVLDDNTYVAQMRLANVRANPNSLFAPDLGFDGGALDLRLQLQPHLQLDIGQLVLFNDALHLTARGRVAAEDAGLSLSIDATIPEVEARNVLAFWPETRVPNTRSWIDRNVLEGQAENLHAAIRVMPGTTPQIGVTFDVVDARVRALRDTNPIEDGQGYLSLFDNELVVALHQGHIPAPNGDLLDVSGSVMTLDDTRQRNPMAHIDLNVTGTVPGALTFIAAEPLTLLDSFPQNPETVANGRANLTASLEFRMQRQIQASDVNFSLSGLLRNIRSDELVPGRVLTAGQLAINANPDRLSIGGRAELDGVDATATWSRALGPGSGTSSAVTGTLDLTPDGLTTFGVTLPNGMVTGAAEASFDLALEGGAVPRLSLQSDLQGLGLFVPAIGWSMAQGSTGNLITEMTLGPSPNVERLEISGSGLELDGAVATSGGQFEELSFDTLRVGSWLNAQGRLISRGQGVAPGVQITGGMADLRGLPSGNGDGQTSGAPIPLDIRLDRLIVTDGIFLSDLSAELAGRPMMGEYRGLIGGETSVSGTIEMQDDGPLIQMRAGDGGRVLAAAGIFADAYGGTLNLLLRPQPGDGRFNGYLEVTNPRLRDAPAIAELLNAISVVGLLEQMATGEGIALGDVEARFQLTPGRVTIQEATAVGPSMGLSLQGIVDTGTEYFDFEGVVSPLYVVNGLIGGLFSPRREGLFGFTYRIAGTPGNSSVSVNPLSVLTPGIFREIFRRPPPQAQ